MRVRVIGSHGGVSPGYRTSCYLLDDHVLIDCGSAASGMTVEQQLEISDIFITHPHLDHIKDICFIIENTFRPERQPLILRSTTEILDDVHKHLLNDVVWPDFSRIFVDQTRTKTILKFQPIEHEVEVHGLKLRHAPVNHPVNAVGYVVDYGKGQIIFSGDTGPTDQLWAEANRCTNLKAIFTEISFPNRMDGLARASGHFTTRQLLDELNKLENRQVPIYIAHFKPQFFDELMEEFFKTAPDRMKLLHQDDEFDFT
jgi:ribonuclease BN (tRNA processing enzyme)